MTSVYVRVRARENYRSAGGVKQRDQPARKTDGGRKKNAKACAKKRARRKKQRQRAIFSLRRLSYPHLFLERLQAGPGQPISQMSLQRHRKRLSKPGTSLLKVHHPRSDRRLQADRQAGSVSKIPKEGYVCEGNGAVDETSLLYIQCTRRRAPTGGATV